VTSRIAAVGLILILALGLAACTGPTPGPEGADLVAAIEDLDGVVQVLPERDTEDDALLSLAVQTTLPGTDDLIDLGTAVADLVDTHDGPPTQLWRDEADDVAGVRVVLGTGTEPAGRLDQVRAFLSLAGVTGMQIQGEGDSVSVVAAADLVAVAETAQRLDVPLAMIATHAQRVTGYLPDGAFTPALARLAAQIDAWDGVTGMFLSGDGGLRVDVQVTGDDRVTAVADALTALDPPDRQPRRPRCDRQHPGRRLARRPRRTRLRPRRPRDHQHRPRRRRRPPLPHPRRDQHRRPPLRRRGHPGDHLPARVGHPRSRRRDRHPHRQPGRRPAGPPRRRGRPGRGGVAGHVHRAGPRRHRVAPGHRRRRRPRGGRRGRRRPRRARGGSRADRALAEVLDRRMRAGPARGAGVETSTGPIRRRRPQGRARGVTAVRRACLACPAWTSTSTDPSTAPP
jgi:hypothetical protein